MKNLFIFILSFPLLTSFGQSINSFCAFNQNGEKYELNLVDGTGSLTFCNIVDRVLSLSQLVEHGV